MKRILSFGTLILLFLSLVALNAHAAGEVYEPELVEEIVACCSAKDIAEGLEPTSKTPKRNSPRHGYIYDEKTMDRLKELARTDPNMRQMKEEDLELSPSPYPLPPGLQFKFVGIRFNQTGGFFPPDTILGVGPNNLIEATNGLVRLSSKTNSNIVTAALNTFFKRPGKFVFDPKVYFDSLSNRYFIVALDLDLGKKQSFILMAISKNATPSNLTSDWCIYKINGRNKNSWADFPSLGMNQNWIAINVNNFDFNNFSYFKDFVKVFPKQQLVNNANGCPKIKVFSFSQGSPVFNINPAQHYTNDSEDLFAMNNFGASNFYKIWRITGTSKPKLVDDGFLNSPTAYSFMPDADQPGNGPNLNTGDNRILQLAYRDGVLSGVHGTGCSFGPAPNESCIRLFQVGGVTSATPPAFVLEHDLGAGKDKWLWHPSIAVNNRGDLTVAGQMSGKKIPLSTAFTGKRVSGNKLEKIKILLRGNCPLVNVDGSGRNRTGDFTGAALDPTDGITTWIAGEVALKTNGRCEWGTVVGKTKYP